MSEKKSLGSDWKGTLFFYPQADTQGWRVETRVLPRNLEKDFYGAVPENEIIEKISIYTQKLSGWQLFHGIFFYHAFIVLKTNLAWWSFEKNTQGITVQRAKTIEYIRDQYHHEPRTSSAKEWQYGQSDKPVRDLVLFLWSKDELGKTYHVLDSNCQVFAQKIFNEFAVNPKKYWYY